MPSRTISKHEKTILETIRDIAEKEKNIIKEIEDCKQKEKLTFEKNRAVSRMYRGYWLAYSLDLCFLKDLRKQLNKGLD